MARRVLLPRLTHRQRMARWQRERQQQAVVITVFTAVLVLVLGIGAFGASDRYYQQNLTPAAQIRGVAIPKREYQAQLKYELVRLYFYQGVPPGFENDPQVAQLKAGYEDIALNRVIEQHVLDVAAREMGVTVTPQQVDDQYQTAFGEFRVRHILVVVDQNATDKDVADATALAKARAIVSDLRAAPMDQDLWNRLAKDRSDDPGSKDSGGELGFASHGQFVREFEDAARALPIGQISDPVKSQFGYHVIQVEEKRDPSQTDIVKKYRSYGYSEADLRARSRYDALHAELERRAQAAAVASPTEQVHVAKILVAIPPPTATDFQSFTAALQKQSNVRAALTAGTDFAQIAKEQSDDADTKDKGGDIGWIARGMITDLAAEDVVFTTETGKVTDPISSTTEWTVYKVLEKDSAKELTADQQGTIKKRAYTYWLERQKRAYDVKKLLVTGIS